jgi:ADP-ribose pyrophosphatase
MPAHGDVQIRAREAAYQGYFRIDRYALRHRLHRGGWSGEMVREVFERGHVAAVLPYDPDRDRIVLIEQFRIGAYAAGEPAWLTEIVAGIIDKDESADGVARRETREETGCELLGLRPVLKYLSSPGGSSETVTLFLGRVDSSKADGIGGLASENEDIRVFSLPWAEIEEGLRTGRFTNALALIALQWLALNHAAARSGWDQGASPA